MQPGAVTENVDFTLLPWVIENGTQYSMSAFLTASLDGYFIQDGESNIIAAFGPDGVCCGVGTWEEGSHPEWQTAVHYYELPGYWYMNLVSDQSN